MVTVVVASGIAATCPSFFCGSMRQVWSTSYSTRGVLDHPHAETLPQPASQTTTHDLPLKRAFRWCKGVKIDFLNISGQRCRFFTKPVLLASICASPSAHVRGTRAILSHRTATVRRRPPAPASQPAWLLREDLQSGPLPRPHSCHPREARTKRPSPTYGNRAATRPSLSLSRHRIGAPL